MIGATADRDEMAEHGSFKHNCGQASYFIKLPPPPPPKPVAPYSEGKCHVKIKQWWNPYTGYSGIIRVAPTNGWGCSYSLQVDIFDNNNQKIGSTPHRVNAGAKSNAKDEVTEPLRLNSKLEDVLEITPLKNGDYIRYTLGGGQTWPSDGKTKLIDNRANCTDVKKQSWATGDVASNNTKEMFRFIDCDFECYWGGGKSSDGS